MQNIEVDSNGFDNCVPFCCNGMIAMVPHRSEAKLLGKLFSSLQIRAQCSNLFPHFLVHAEFNKCLP